MYVYLYSIKQINTTFISKVHRTCCEITGIAHWIKKIIYLNKKLSTAALILKCLCLGAQAGPQNSRRGSCCIMDEGAGVQSQRNHPPTSPHPSLLGVPAYQSSYPTIHMAGTYREKDL